VTTHVVGDMCQWDSARDVDTTLVLFLEDNIRWFLVYPNSETFQLVLDDLLIGQGLIHIEDNEDEMASLGDGDNLSSTTFAILGSLNDTGQIENLDFSSVIHQLSGDGRQGREFVGRSCT